jgi:hypothetical protein
MPLSAPLIIVQFLVDYSRNCFALLFGIVVHQVFSRARSQSSVNVALSAVMANVHDNLRSARERAVTAEEQAAIDFALESFNRIGEAMVAGLTAGAAETDPNQHPVP